MTHPPNLSQRLAARLDSMIDGLPIVVPIVPLIGFGIVWLLWSARGDTRPSVLMTLIEYLLWMCLGLLLYRAILRHLRECLPAKEADSQSVLMHLREHWPSLICRMVFGMLILASIAGYSSANNARKEDSKHTLAGYLRQRQLGKDGSEYCCHANAAEKIKEAIPGVRDWEIIHSTESSVNIEIEDSNGYTSQFEIKLLVETSYALFSKPIPGRKRPEIISVRRMSK